MKVNIKKDSRNKSSIKEFNYNNSNPYLPAVVEHISEKKYRKASGVKWEQVLNEDTGELEKRQNLILGTQKRVDSQEWYKVFNGSIMRFYGLGKNTMEVFGYIMKNIQYSNDRICIPPSDVVTQTGMALSTYYRCIVQLLNAQVLAKAEKEGCYYINPAIAFKGDRITLVTQYIKDTKEQPRMKDPKTEAPDPEDIQEEPMTDAEYEEAVNELYNEKDEI